MPDPDITAFARMVGATEPSSGDDMYVSFRRMFKRHNYFILQRHFFIVKISRTKKSFWGIGKPYIDFASELNNYYVVLLTSSQEGWVFSKADVDANISSEKWRLREKDNNYKINPPLPDRNAFSGRTSFYEKLRISEH